MDTKKIITYVIFLALLAVSIFLAYWFYQKYMQKDVQSTPSSGSTTPAPAPAPETTTADPNIGKEAYAGTAGTLYDLAGNKVKDFVANDDLGKITDVKDQTFILDGKNTVDISLVLTR